ncbi:MAG: sugar phosphate isomerase/epimerase [Chloroflexota bacterium]|nr:sugar phosphate isomerase/epimerase [Chloroflexota bacterium]
MQLAVSSWSLRSHINNEPSWTGRPVGARDFPVYEFPRYVKETFGVDAVEVCEIHIPRPDAARLDQLKESLQSSDVRVVNVPIDVGDISQPDATKREHDLKLIEFWLDVAAYLGSPAARVNSGSGNLESAIESYQRLARYGEQVGVRLVLENHGGLSADLGNIQRMLESVPSNFGTSPDFGNFPEEKRYDGLALMVPRAAVVHAKTYDFNAAGEFHNFDFARCLSIVRDSGFDGYLSVEFEGKGDQPQGVRQTIDLIRRLEPSVQAA